MKIDLWRKPVLDWAVNNLIEIAIALTIAAAVVALLYGIKALVLRAVKKLGAQNGLTEVFVSVVRKTRLWFLIAVSLRMVQGYLHPPQDVAKTIAFAFTVAVALQVASWARALILGIITHRTSNLEGDPNSMASAMGIIRLLVSVVVFAIAIIVILDNLGANVTGLVAGLGIGGIAIGLAAQGIFSDLFAALSIIFDKPFCVGDTITYQGKEGPVTGVVQRIGLKSTRIRSLAGDMRIIGNTQLLAQEVTNFTGREVYRFQLPISVIHQTPYEDLQTIPSLLRAEVDTLGYRFVRAGLRAFGPSSIDYDFIFEISTNDVLEAHAGLQKVALAVLAKLRERDIRFAYPTQTSFTAAPDGSLVMPYPEVMPVMHHEQPES
ncbi:mechanosensitive ion channel family protein [Croceibacterium sp. LX-88]|uniref:Mechanosensitive ion channel family protein n=1 Tax=Croceibacterium selenioxidans TaxID=2838833 RepID=A0ABS5W824_9SPHN|nr:mechanosensitive ion channel family protein [Croceibacterium selenioxidans]